MIALRTIHGKAGKRPFKILEGREIPKHYIRLLDIKRLKTEGVIEDDKKPIKEQGKGVDH
jgi:hypothetical protein